MLRLSFFLSWLVSTQCVHLSVVQRLCALFWSNPLKPMCDTLLHFFLQSQPPPPFFFLQPSTLQTLTFILGLGDAWMVFSFNVGASPRGHVAGPAANLFTLASTLGKSCARDRVRDASPRTKPPQATSVCFFSRLPPLLPGGEKVKYSFNKFQLNATLKETNVVSLPEPGADQSSRYILTIFLFFSLSLSRKYNPRNEASEIAAHL